MELATKSVQNDSQSKHPASHARVAMHRFTPGVSQGAFQFAGVQQSAGNLAVQRLFKSGALQAKLSISRPDDPYEREADRVADEVTRAPEQLLARKCASCESTGASCAACASDETMQRKTESPASTAGTSDSASPVHSSGIGEPLNRETRALMEPHFGSDLSQVRVHTDARAAESARSVNALAYTVGRDIVFGARQYAPQTSAGQKLLAHELTHFMQQSSAAFQPMLQRACITDPECEPAEEGELPGTAVKGSATHFHTSVKREEKEIAEKEKSKTPREIRDELCDKVPPDPACTADGHASRATVFEEVFGPYARVQFALADGVFVDKAISKGVGAYVKKCKFFKPKLEGDECIFIPERLEKQAARYHSGEKKIGGEDREEWFGDTLEIITHELEHVRFRKEFPKTEPRPEACEFGDVSHELSELAAIISEFPVFFRAHASKAWHERRVETDKWFNYKLTQPSRHGETIAGIIKAIRCRCECEDVNAYLKRVVEFTTASWTEVEKNTFHEELRDPKWKLDWPIQTPPPPRDIPSWLLTPSLSLGYGYLGRAGFAANLSLDAGIPVDRLGKWRLLLGAQARILPQMSADDQFVYTLGLKVGFLHGPKLGSRGVQFGAFGEIGKGSFQSGTGTEGGIYAAGGFSLRYSPGLQPDRSLIPFIGIDVAGGGRIDMAKPEVQKVFFVGVTFGGEY